MKAKGIDSEFYIWDDKTHGFFNYKNDQKNGGPIYQEVQNKTDAFLIKHGYLK
jgi:hypothetical protein